MSLQKLLSIVLQLIILAFLVVCGGSSSSNNTNHQCDTSTDGIDFSEIDRVKGFTVAHNTLREKMGLPALSWDNNLAKFAYVWVNELIKNNNCQMKHRPQVTNSPCKQLYGENIAWNYNYEETPQGVTKSWYSEVEYYNYADNSCQSGQECGHYTQVIWRDTTHLGCAMLSCPNNQEMWVCNYNPPGNFIGEKPY